MKKLLLSFMLFVFLNTTFAANGSFIQSLEGKVMLNKVPATKGALVKSADEITTLANSKATWKNEGRVFSYLIDFIFIEDGGFTIC